MEPQLSFSSISIFSSFSSISIFSFLLFTISLLILRKKTQISSNPPPGPPKLPLIGNLHQLISSLPHHRLADLSATYGPDLMQLQLGQVSALVVSSPNAAEQVLKHFDVNFTQRGREYVTDILFYNRNDIVFAPYGEYWKQMRKICTMEVLSLKRVKSFRSIREEEVAKCITSIHSKLGSPVNLSSIIFSLTNSMITISAVGRKLKDIEAFTSLIEPIVKALGGFDFVSVFPSLQFIHLVSGTRSRLLKLRQKYDLILEDLIREHKLEKKGCGIDDCNNLLDVLLNLQEQPDSMLTNDRIKAIILDMFLGGTETSASTIEWAIAELMKDSNIMKKAQEEIRRVHSECGKIDETVVDRLLFLKAIIKETMRLHPPGTLIPRKCREKCKIDGYDIDINTEVLINAWAIGRDPKYWVEPKRFCPERFIDNHVDYKGTNFEYLPFGAGRRMCPGINFGIAMIQLVLAKLLCHFDWKLAQEMKSEELDMTEEFGVAVKKKHHLFLVPTAYFHPMPYE